MNCTSTYFGGAKQLRLGGNLLLLALFLFTAGLSANPLLTPSSVITTIDWTAPVPGLYEVANVQRRLAFQTTRPASVNAAMMQCFGGFSAGSDTTYCDGEIATLDGGFDSYIGGGNTLITWDVVEGDGNFLFGGFSVPSPSLPNGSFATSSNGLTTDTVRYQPAPSDTLVVLELTVQSNDPACTMLTTDTVQLFFYPEQTAILAGFNGSDQVFGPGTGAASDTLQACSGDAISLEITNPTGVIDGDPEGLIPMYSYEVSGAANITGLPTSGIVEASFFANDFDNLTVVNNDGSPQTATVSIRVFYDRDGNAALTPGIDCEGPVTEAFITVLPAAQASATFVGAINDVYCESDTARVRITGTPLSRVAYEIDPGTGTYDILDTLLLGAAGTNGSTPNRAADFITLDLDGIGGSQIRILLTEVRYQGGTPCPNSISFEIDADVIATPVAAISLVSAADSLYCNGNLPSSIDFNLTSGEDDTYVISVEENVGGTLDTTNYTVMVAGGTGTFSVAPTAMSAPGGQVIQYSLVNVARSAGAMGAVVTCDNPTRGPAINVFEERDPAASFDVSRPGMRPQTVSTMAPITVAVCDGDSVTFANFAGVASTAGLDFELDLTISGDQYGFFGTDRTFRTNIAQAVAGLSTRLDLPNSERNLQTITLTFEPRYDLPNTSQVCAGDVITVIVEVQPPFDGSLASTPAAVPGPTTLDNPRALLCSGEDITFTLTSGAAGLATVLDFDGTSQSVAVNTPDGTGGFTGEFTQTNVTSAASFSFIDVVTPAGCRSEFNQTIEVDVEELPTATLSPATDTICNNEATIFQLDVVAGAGTTVDYFASLVATGTGSTTPISGTATVGATENIPFNPTPAPGTYTLQIDSLVNTGSAGGCTTRFTPATAPTATVVVEEAPVYAGSWFDQLGDPVAGSARITMPIDETMANNGTVCDGDELDLVVRLPQRPGLGGQNPPSNPGANGAYTSTITGDSLFFLLTVTQDNSTTFGTGTTILTPVYPRSDARSVVLEDQAFTNPFSVPVDVDFEVVAFFAPTRPTPAQVSSLDLCSTPSANYTITVEPTPEGDFGSNQTICFGESATIDLTGSTDAEITVEVMEGTANVGTLTNVGADTIITLNGNQAFLTTGALEDTLRLRITQVESPFGCINTQTLDVEVIVLPLTDAFFTSTPDTTTVCQGSDATLSVTGTPGATVYYSFGADVSSTTSVDSFLINATDSMGTLTFPNLLDSTTFTIDSIVRYELDQTGDTVRCVNAPDSVTSRRVLIEGAPEGDISAIEPVCADAEQPLLVFTPTAPASAPQTGATYTLVINGDTYTNVQPGVAFPTTESTLSTTTTYNLTAITETTAGSRMCVSLPGLADTALVQVEAAPTVSLDLTLDGTATTVTSANDTFSTVVCSGADFALIIDGMPGASITGDPLFYNVDVTDPTSILTNNGSFNSNFSDADATAFFNGANPTLVNPAANDATITVSFVPYFETNPQSAPAGPTGANACATDTVTFVITVKDELEGGFAPGQSDPAVCEGSTATLVFTGTPNTRITFFEPLTNLTFNVITDANGDATFETTALTATTSFVVTGLGTVNEDPDCNVLTNNSDVHTVTVVPTPQITASLSADTICANSSVNLNLSGGPANGTVTYTENGANQMVTLDANGEAIVRLTLPGANQVDLDSIAIVIDSTFSNPTPFLCGEFTPLSLQAIVRPQPLGTITAGDPVCLGDRVPLVFNATVRTQNAYQLLVENPLGQRTVYNNVNDGETFATVDRNGTYTLLRIRDGRFSNALSCTTQGAALSTTTVIIEPEPDLKVRLSQGSNIQFDNGTAVSTYTTVLCSGDPLTTTFSSITENSRASGDLAVSVSYNDPTGTLDAIYAMNPDSANANPASQLNFTAAFNNTTGANQLITVVYTPYFEGRPECEGPPLTFNITVTPELDATIVAVDDSLCVGDVAEFAINGTPDAFVRVRTSFLANVRPLTAFNEIQLDANGQATVLADVTAAGAGFANLDRIRKVTTVGSQTRTCSEPIADTARVIVSDLPTGRLVASDNGPICFGDPVTLGFETDFGPGSYTLTVDGTQYTVTTTAPAGTLDTADFLRDSPAQTTAYELTTITYAPTGCSITSTPISLTTVTVNDVPAGTLTATDMNATSTSASVAGDTATVCANDSLTVAGMATSTAFAPEAVYAAVSYSGDVDYFGLGNSVGTVFLDPTDIEATFSARFQNLSSTVRYVDLDVVYYLETAPGAGATLDSDECIGDTTSLTIAILPNPVGRDVSATICSGEALNFDLDGAITNIAPNPAYTATYRYTVVSTDPGLTVPNRLVATGEDITIAADELMNLTGSPQTLTYTVTPAFDACVGNDFTFTLTVNPEGAIESNLDASVCSGLPVGILLSLSNDPDMGVGNSYNLISITPSTNDPGFTGAASNASVADGVGPTVITNDVFTNLTTGDQTVTYRFVPVTSNGCVGDTTDIVATIFPQPVAMNLRDTVCSGVRLETDIIGDLVTNMVGSPNVVSFQRRRLAGVTNFFVIDENNDQVLFTNGVQNGTSTNAVLRDSLINGTTSPFSLFYDITVDDANGCGPVMFTYELLVAPPAEATLVPETDATFCTGESIRLIAGINTNSAPADISYSYSVLSADSGVVVNLTPSGAAVRVTGATGTLAGDATVMVFVTDQTTGCTATATQTVTVGVTPMVQTIQGPTNPCTNTLAIYEVNRVGNNTYSFSIDDPSIGLIIPTGVDTSFSVLVDGAPPRSAYTLTVVETSPDGCETTNTLLIEPALQGTDAAFTFQVSPTNPLEYTFINQSAGTANSYIWNFGDGTTSTDVNPTHVFPDNPNNPGAPFDYDVTLMVVGSCAPFQDTETQTITVNGGDVCETVSLGIGLNFISFTVEPSDSLVENIFNVGGVQQVLGFNGGSPQTFIPGNGAANTPGFVISKGAAYIVITNQAIDITVCGQAIDPNFKRPLNAGVNFVGYMGVMPEAADSYLAGLINPAGTGPLIVAQTFGNNVSGGGQNYVQNGGAANSLTQFTRGQGYRIIVNQPVGSYRGNTANTEAYEFYYGDVSGPGIFAGAEIEVLNEAGEVVQIITPDANGHFTATPVFGEVYRADGSYAPGLRDGEQLSFRFNGEVIEMEEGYQGGFGVRELNLTFGLTSAGAEATAGVSLRITPNPVVNRATITLETATVLPVKLLLLDVNGRVVKQLYVSDQLAVGTTRLEWTEAADLAPGMYTVIALSEGQLLEGLTQRLIKQ